MDIQPLSFAGAQAPQLQQGEEKQREQQEERIEHIIHDMVTFSKRDVSPRGTITLIVQLKEKEVGEPVTCDPVKEECKQCGLGELKEELEVINGFTFEINPKNLKKFITLLPENVEITVDHPLSFF
jgi:hypothetical protein